MPLPRIEKEWQYDVGRDLGRTFGPSAEDLAPAFFLSIKNALIGFARNPWQPWGSSDGVTAGMDRVDRWIDDEDLVWIASGTPFAETDPRSWIVLRNSAGLFLLLHCIGSGNGDVHAMISKAGFTGGSINAAPTAIDGATIDGGYGDIIDWDRNIDNTGVNRLQLLHSADGRETRMFFTRTNDQALANGYSGGWLIGELADAPRALTKPFFAAFDPVDNTNVSMYRLTLGKRTAVFLPSGPAVATFMTEHSYVLDQLPSLIGVGPCLEAPNDISGEWPVQPLYVYDPDTGATLGRVKDMWLGSPALAAGTTFPLGGPSKFAQFGALVVPWPSSLGAPVTE